MKRLIATFVALARIAEHKALILHRLGDLDEEEHARQLARHYMDSARFTKSHSTGAPK